MFAQNKRGEVFKYLLHTWHALFQWTLSLAYEVAVIICPHLTGEELRHEVKRLCHAGYSESASKLVHH